MDQGQGPSNRFINASDSIAEAAAGSAFPQARALPPRKKASTACRPCQRRKTKCSGDQPCTKCVQKGIEDECLIDSNADLRRKGASDRRIEDLLHDRQLLDGILDTIRLGDDGVVQSLSALVRHDATKQELWTFVESFLQDVSQNDDGATETETIGTSPEQHRQDQTYVPHRPRPSLHDLLNDDFAIS